MTPRRWLALALAGVGLLLVAARVGAALYVDHAWYAALGAEELWRAKVVNTLLLRGITAALGSAFVFVNLYFVRHSIVSLVLPRRVGNLEIGEEVSGRLLMRIVVALSIALGAVLTIPYGEWTLLAQAWHGRPFGESDPYHLVDLGFYVHWLPLEVALYYWALLALLVVVFVVVALYALTPSLRWERGTVRATTYVRRHLVALGTLAMVLLAWSYRLDQYRLLVHGSGPASAFTYADHRVRLPANAALALLACGFAVLVLLTGWAGQLRRALAGVSAVLVLSLALRQVMPALATRMGAPVDPTRREAPYLEARASYTRRATALETLLPADSVPRIANLAALARDASAWDASALVAAVGRAPGAGPVVGAPSWVARPDGLHALLVERAPAEAALDPTVPWQVVELRVDGSVAAPALDVGAVERVLNAPIVHPGARAYQIVSDPGGRVPAPALRTLLARLAFAWGEQNLRFLDPELGTGSARVILRRDVAERVRALVPFFEQGGTVTPIEVGGQVYWTMHLYSASEWYPLSAPTRVGDEEWKSWRLAATAVVHGTTGRVSLVPAAARDAIAESWIRRFPRLFTTAATLPPAVLAQLPPAVDGAQVLASTLAAVGLRGEAAPPRRTTPVAGGDTLAARAATPFAVGGEVATAFPLVDASDRIAGVVVAVGGVRPRAAWVPVAPAGTRWEGVRERAQRAGDTLLATRDTRIVAGALRAVPVGGSIALLRTQYRTRADLAPELARVAVAFGDSLLVGPSLPAALGTAQAPGAAPAVSGDLRARAAALYDRAREALRRGDWPAFGAAYDELGRLLGRPPR